MKKLIRKLLWMALTLFLAVTAIFLVIRLSPGDPVEKILGANATEVDIANYREQLGLNKSFVTQYVDMLSGLLRGDLGLSLFKKKSVIELIKIHFPATITLSLVTIFFSSIIGIFWGAVTGFNQYSLMDRMVRFFSLIGLSLPIFSLAPILVYFFSIYLGWLPVSEWGEIKHIILPALTLVVPLSTIIIRVTRSKFLDESNELWVTVLRAKGLSQVDVLLRILKVCLPTVLNVIAIQLSVVLAGTMVTETIFDIPGMGLLLFESIQNRDYPVVQGVVVYSTIIYVVVYFLIDYVNEVIDSRIVD